jgi:hypothetical protein
MLYLDDEVANTEHHVGKLLGVLMRMKMRMLMMILMLYVSSTWPFAAIAAVSASCAALISALVI